MLSGMSPCARYCMSPCARDISDGVDGGGNNTVIIAVRKIEIMTTIETGAKTITTTTKVT